MKHLDYARASVVLGTLLVSLASCAPGKKVDTDGGIVAASDASPLTNDFGSTPRELCAGCLSPRGGETGDFVPGSGPLPDPCSTRIYDIATDTDAGAEASALGAELEGEIEMAAEWDELEGATERPAQGFMASTNVSLRVRVVQAQRVEREAKEPEDESFCVSYLQFQTEIDVATADGALRGQFLGSTRELADDVWVFSATATANHFTGSLELGARPEDGEAVLAELALYFYEGNVRGRLTPMLQTAETQQEAASPLMVRSVELSFPVDHCSVNARPIGKEERQALTEQARERIAQSNPLPGNHWLLPASPVGQDAGSESLASPDPERPVNTSFTFGDVTRGCRSLQGNQVAFDAAVGLSLDDGWLDLESAAFGEWSVGTDGEFTKLDLHVAREPLPAADFEREFGLTGVDVSQVECAQMTAYSRYEIQEGGLMTQGSVEVLGGPCDSVFSHFGNQTLAFVSWCDGCEYPQRPSFNP